MIKKIHIGARQLSYWSTSVHDWVVVNDDNRMSRDDAPT